MHSQGTRIEDEVVDWLGVWASRGTRAADRGFGCVVGRYCLEALGDVCGACGFVEGAMQGREEVVDVAVEGGDAEGVSAVFEEEDVDEGAVLKWLLGVCWRWESGG